MWKNIVIIVFLNTCTVKITGQFYACDDDPGFDPEDGAVPELRFTWLGTLQYIQVKTGNPNYYRAPRVILISKQFGLCTANDAGNIPDGYALGNVAFGEYERDEHECDITTTDIANGLICEPSILLMPIADVLLHPEYKHFHVNRSIALLKLVTNIKSKYMLPLCLPFKDYLRTTDDIHSINYRYLNVDFSSDVPRDLAEESKDAVTIGMMNYELCGRYFTSSGDDSGESNPGGRINLKNRTWSGFNKTRIMCSSECGFHSGAPTIVHEHTGHWTLVAISAENSMCPDPLKSLSNLQTPRHIAIYDYVSWITTAISGKTVRAFADDDPFGYLMPRTSRIVERGRSKWVGHWWMGGIRCYDRGLAAEDLFKFYHEIFFVNPNGAFHMNYYLEINVPNPAAIACVKVGMPYANRGEPRVWDLETNTVKLRIPMLHFTKPVKFHVEAWGFNKTYTSSENEDN